MEDNSKKKKCSPTGTLIHVCSRCGDVPSYLPVFRVPGLGGASSPPEGTMLVRVTTLSSECPPRSFLLMERLVSGDHSCRHRTSVTCCQLASGKTDLLQVAITACPFINPYKINTSKLRATFNSATESAPHRQPAMTSRLQ